LISSPFGVIEGVTVDTCGAENGNFYYYNVETGKWVVDTVGILNLKKGVGYWFYSSKSCEVTISGSETVTSNDITIEPGWNHIASPTEGLADAHSLKIRCTKCAGGICSSMKTLWYNPIFKDWVEVSSLEPGKGYHVQCVNPHYYEEEQSSPYTPFLDFFKFFKT